MKGTLRELESCILGVVWRRGPCSAYVVRREFAASHSAQWSASAGSIYPAIARLRDLGLVTSESVPWGGKTKSLLALTHAGRSALEDWISTLDARSGDPTSDPIRTRFFFLDALESADARREAVKRAEDLTAIKLEELRRHVAHLRSHGTAVEHLAASGGVFELEARLRWLAEVRGLIG